MEIYNVFEVFWEIDKLFEVASPFLVMDIPKSLKSGKLKKFFPKEIVSRVLRKSSICPILWKNLGFQKKVGDII